jgi:hypothetical protein
VDATARDVAGSGAGELPGQRAGGEPLLEHVSGGVGELELHQVGGVAGLLRLAVEGSVQRTQRV